MYHYQLLLMNHSYMLLHPYTLVLSRMYISYYLQYLHLQHNYLQYHLHILIHNLQIIQKHFHLLLIKHLKHLLYSSYFQKPSYLLMNNLQIDMLINQHML